MRQFTKQAEGYTANNENDFSHDFGWAVYTREDDRDDWWWNREAAYVVIDENGHRDIYRVEDSIGECGFLDWTVEWYVETVGETDKRVEDMTPQELDTLFADAEHCERMSEECSQGYSSNPTCHLQDLLGDDNCVWYKRAAYIHDSETGELYRCTPGWICGSNGTEVDLIVPRDGEGYLCDVMIDTESFIREILGHATNGTAADDQVAEIVCDRISDRWHLDTDCDAKWIGSHDAMVEAGVEFTV